MTAELHRNLGFFDECMELINKLNKGWDWLKIQFEWECKRKYPFTFEIISEAQMALEKSKIASYSDYIDRGKIYLRRGYEDKALADFNKAEELGFPDDWWGIFDFYDRRGLIYSQYLNEHDKAITEYNKALLIAKTGKEKNLLNAARILHSRSAAYKIKGDIDAALADITEAIETNDKVHVYFTLRQKLHKEKGNIEAANWDKFKADLLLSSNQKKSTDDNYKTFCSLRQRLYTYEDKPIREIIGKEDWLTLACILAREEDYKQLERYVKERLPLNETASSIFCIYELTPLYYITTLKVWASMKEPEKMLRWLVGNGADPNKKAADESIPLSNQCFRNGNYNTMKALLEAGADPNAETFENGMYLKPLALLTYIADYESNSNITKKEIKQIEKYFTKEEIKSYKKRAILLREYGAEEPHEEEEEPDDDGRYDAWS
jgi:tetratricopeptide (TPR) repeat protein